MGESGQRSVEASRSSSGRLRRFLPVALGLVAVWVASGVRTLDPALEFGVVRSPLSGALSVRTERSFVVAPPGLLRLARYPLSAVELPLPQAETAMIEGPNGTRFGLRGQVVLQVRPDEWRRADEASNGDGLRGILLAAARVAGARLIAATSDDAGGRRPALSRELEKNLSDELAQRGVALKRLSFSSLDYLAVATGTKAPPAPSKVLVVGLDGADWAILDPLLAQGRMPNLAKLVGRGVRAKLLSISPMLSPVVWTTVATGVEPSRHGILDFLVQDPKTGAGQPVTSAQRKTPALWEMLSEAGVKVGVVAWWASWPADPVAGYVVSDRIAYQLFGFRSDAADAQGKTWPAEFYDEVQRRIVAPDRVAWEQVVPYLDGPRKRREEFDDEERKLLDEFRTLLASGETYLSVALEGRRRFDPSFEAVYFEGTDTVGHLFMPYRPPERPGVDPRRFASFRSMVDRYYETVDGYLGRLLEGRGDEWTVLVVSDHGFASDATRPLTTDSRIGHGPAADWHRKFGILVAAGGPIVPGSRIEETSVFDLAPTVLALFGQPVPTSWPGKVLGSVIAPEFLARHPVRFRRDDPLRGEGEAGEALAADPAAAELREKLANLGYISSGDSKQVSVSAANNTGVALMAEGKYEEAAEQFRRGLAEQPNQANLLVNLGLALRMLGRSADAREPFEQAMGFPVARRAAGHQLAQIAMEASDLAGAETYLRTILAEEPGASEVRNTLGLVLEKQGKEAAAEAEYLQASEADPNAAQPRSNLGNLAKQRERLDEAEAWYLKAIEADPYFMGAYNNLALVYQERGRLDQAIDLYARALAKSPDNAVVMNNLGSLYYARGELDEAESLWTKSSKADPKYPSPLNNLGGLALGAGDLARAESLLARALELEANYGDARINLAIVRRSQGRLDDARAELRRAVDDPRSRANAQLQLGILELQERNPAAARRWLRAARGARARDANLLNALGEACQQLGNDAEAADAWRASLAIDPAQEAVRSRLESLSAPR